MTIAHGEQCRRTSNRMTTIPLNYWLSLTSVSGAIYVHKTSSPWSLHTHFLPKWDLLPYTSVTSFNVGLMRKLLFSTKFSKCLTSRFTRPSLNSALFAYIVRTIIHLSFLGTWSPTQSGDVSPECDVISCFKSCNRVPARHRWNHVIFKSCYTC